MTDRGTRRLAWSLWALTLAVLAVNVSLAVRNGSIRDEGVFVIFGIAMALGYGTVGVLVASRQRSNVVGWILLAAGLGLMVGILSDEVAHHASIASNDPLPGTRWFVWFGPVGFIGGMIQIPLLLLLFPDGTLPSGRWRAVAVMLLGGAGMSLLLIMVDPRVQQPYPGLRIVNPTGVEALRGVISPLILVAGLVTMVGSVLCVAALFVRYRRASGEVRQQLRWLAYIGLAAVTVLVVGFVLGGLLGDSSSVANAVWALFVSLVAVGIPAACGIAILRYRLYDLDLVVKKTVVFGALVIVGTVVYLAVVVGLGAAIGGADSPVLTFAGAAIVALAFQPVRTRARRLADRLVYGKRATPYEVLSEFSGRMGGTYSTEDVLPRMTQLIVAGTGAERAEVWLRVGDGLRLEARSPETDGPAPGELPVDGDTLPAIPGAGEVLPVVHQGELLGAIAVAVSASEPLTPSGRKLLEDLAAQAGLVLRNVALTADLRARLEELRASRQRLVTAQDEERRRLERNIHDGAQQQLVALSVKLRLLEGLADRDPAKAAELARQLGTESQEALENLRDLARGIYPPLLADQGLAAALGSQARRSAVAVQVDAGRLGRFSQEVEAAVYFCVLEALQNATKYAEASGLTIRLQHRDGLLAFEVIDDGRGFDAASVRRGAGMQNMADRLAALGGELDVRSQPGRGTRVLGRLPALELEPATT